MGGLNKICPTCKKRDVVINDGCAVCLFFRSDDEQSLFRSIISEMYETAPESLSRPTQDQVWNVIAALPYICTYKAQYMGELRYFVGKVFEEITEHHTVDIKEEIEEIDNRWVA